MTLRSLRGSALALALACAATAGCASGPPPIVDPYFASGAYAPARVAVMPPDVFIVIDKVGDNDDAASAALGEAVSNETVGLVASALHKRGYDVDLSSRWDGIIAQDGTVLVNRDELGALANGVLEFGNSPAANQKAPPQGPLFVAPELAGKVGWATQSDALLYINVKGVSPTRGKQAAGVVAAVFIVVVVAVIILAIIASSKSSGGGGGSSPGGWHGSPSGVSGAGHGGGGAWHGTPGGSGASNLARPSTAWHGAPGGSSGVAAGGGGWHGAAPAGRPYGAPVYYGGPRVSFGVGVFVPLDGPVYTHDGTVTHDDDLFAGDELYVSMTLVSTYDGRVLWHVRQELDLDAQNPRDVDKMVGSFLAKLPARGAPAAPAAPAKP